jgi:hypothetical protein
LKPVLLDLKDGKRVLIDETDAPKIEGKTIYLGTNGYAYYSTWEGGRSYPRTLHSLLVDAPKGAHIDHINGDKLDNRQENSEAEAITARRAAELEHFGEYCP